MTCSTQINMDQLSKEGKSFKWEKEFCEKCHRYMWGHGFTTRYFQSYPEPLYIKRYRCAGCSIVVTCRPLGFWPSLRTEFNIIFNALIYRLSHSADPPVWPVGVTRQRGGYWLRTFYKYFKMNVSQPYTNPIDFLYSLKRASQNFFA